VKIRDSRWIKQSQGFREDDETPKSTRETTARDLLALRWTCYICLSYLQAPVADVTVCYTLKVWGEVMSGCDGLIRSRFPRRRERKEISRRRAGEGNVGKGVS
jgi:hypothetical protein